STARALSGVGLSGRKLSAPLVADLEGWLRQQRAKLSRGNDLAKAMDYCSNAGRPSPASSMTDGSAFRTTPPSERYAELPSAESHGYSPVPTAAASAAVMYSLMVTAKLNNVDPQAWLADVL